LFGGLTATAQQADLGENGELTTSNVAIPGYNKKPLPPQDDVAIEFEGDGTRGAANDDCTGATPIVVPSSTIDTTVGMTLDAVATCVTTISAPGVWFSVTGTGNTITATTCNATSDYDTKINVYCGSCAALTCITGNDDGGDESCDCPNCGGNNYESRVTWCSAAGQTYFILVQGFGGEVGTFQLDVSDDGIPCGNPVPCGPCDVTCADTEGEPDCFDLYVDATNGGCNSVPPVFTTIQCGQTVCGDAGTFLGPAGANYRDTDWWLVTVTQRTILTWTARAEFPLLIGFVAQPCPQTAFLAFATGTPCQQTTVTSACLNPGQYVCFVAPSVFTGVTCGSQYTATLTCVSCESGACCLPAACQVLTAANCAAAGGSYQGDGTNCGSPTYTLSTCTTPFEDISGTGTIVAGASGTDDGVALAVPIGFNINYFGNTYSTINISNNGVMSFTGTPGFTNAAIPTAAAPNDLVAPLWDDLDSRVMGTVHSQQLAAPQRFIVQWTNEQRFPTTGGPNTLQAILFANGDIDFRYGALEGSPPLTPSIGIEDSTGTIGISIAPGDIGTGNTCRHFQFNAGVDPCAGGGCTCANDPFGNDTDTDGNGLIDLQDLATLLANFGTATGATCQQGDNDGDGDVDLADLANLLAVFGLTC
jgi:hypothetical protein